MKKMLINARQPEETRIAIVEDGKLVDLDIETVDRQQKKANVYKAKISRIEPSLNAVFVNYGDDKNGFLPVKEIAPELFIKTPENVNTPINELLEVGQELIVQIAKEERGSKGAALTTFITLAGCYMVLMPNKPEAGGISRKIEGDERRKLKALFDSLTIPKDMGIIMRTAGVDRSAVEIQADLDSLVNLWEAIKRISFQRKAPFLIHKESDITMRAIRDHLKDDIQEIIIDTEDSYNDLKRQLNMLRPHFIDRLQYYSKEMPLFSSYQIERQIENTFKREVQLPSGGSIVIDTTEALTAIDINSARATKGDNIEETAFITNLEAADEIARQLRLRDLGGLVVIDFIDMQFFPNQKTVEQKLIESLQSDRARVQMTRISKFGLVELSRQRLQASLSETVMHACPRCQGHGFIRSIPSISLSILRQIRAESLRDKTNEIRVQLPLDVATYLLNEKREDLSDIETNSNVKVLLIPNANLQSPHYQLQRIYGDAYHTNRSSDTLIAEQKGVDVYRLKKQKSQQQPAIKVADFNKQETAEVKKIQPSPSMSTGSGKTTTDKKSIVVQNSSRGFWSKLVDYLFKEEKTAAEISPTRKEQTPKSDQHPKNVTRSDSNQLRKNNEQKGSRPQQNRKPEREEAQKDRRDNRDNRAADDTRRHEQKKQRFDNKSDNRKNGASSRRRNSNLQVHGSEELIDISAAKQPSTEQAKTRKEKAMMKTISSIPEEKISWMVNDVLNNADTLASDNAVQVETSEKTSPKQKYLKFEVISTQQLTKKREEEQAKLQRQKAKAQEQAAKKAAEAEKTEEVPIAKEDEKTLPQKPKTRSRKSRKTQYIEYSAAVDAESQGFVSQQ
ncbi:MAG: Rne/Rng family ribonuclease [Francisellaceae bacterium]